MIQDVNSAISPDQSVLNSCSTAITVAALPPLLLFRYTNPPFGHRRKYTKRLIIRKHGGQRG